MFIDTRTVENGSVIKSRVCIIGAGVAGITIALELQKQGIEAVLLESGGFKADKLTRDLYVGENIGLPYTFADGSRSRYLGGSSNCWGGWCAPMTNIDFEKRDWVNFSGWPIDLKELEPYYRAAHEVLKLGPYNYDPAYWEKAINRQDVRRAPLISLKIKDEISQFSPPARMGILYGEKLKSSREITTYLYANVTSIDTDETGHTITSATITTFAGNTIKIEAVFFVLAAGGIENARLLLNSDKVQKNGLGNQKDIVGRFFMDHPRILTGNIQLAPEWSANKLYDIRYQYHNPQVGAHDICIASQFVLTPETMQKESLLHARVSLYSVFPYEKSNAVLAANRLKDYLFKRRIEGFRPRKDIVSVVSHPLEIGIYGLAAKMKRRSWVREVKFQLIMEQEPNPLSRVMLTDEKDRLGMQRVKVNWQLGEAEERTFNKTLKIVAEELKACGVIGYATLDTVTNKEWPAGLTGTWHHMGTTRMHQSPQYGVVNRDCLVHDTNNLFIAGSSVFPTVGANFPTITLTALAIRLSAHLNNELKKINKLVAV
jgi:choline dehydrogenase-like flavoprotein